MPRVKRPSPLRPKGRGDPSDILEGLADTKRTAVRLMVTLVVLALFSVLAFGQPDAFLLDTGASVSLPSVGATSARALLVVGPLLLIGVRVLLQVYVEHWRALEGDAAGVSRAISPLHHPLLRVATWFVMWLLVPLTLAGYVWKAMGLPETWGYALFVVLVFSVGIMAIHFAWGLSRTRRGWLAFAAAAAFLIATTGFSMIHDRGWRRPLDLRFAELVRTDLSGMDLRRADLRSSNLEQADLSGAILRGANLERADLSGAILIGADLSEAVLRDADLNDANLSVDPAEFAKWYVSTCNQDRCPEEDDILRLWDTIRREALGHPPTAMQWQTRLTGADMRGANLRGANLAVAVLVNANVGGANLQDAEMMNASLTHARLDGANLGGAHLNGADLTNVHLGSAKLNGTDMSLARISPGDAEYVFFLTGACGDEGTKLPWPLKDFKLPPCEDR